ncbi:MAG: aminotransferase class I/II-fold pyridoxal phosphate-dependent enzyme [Candidatus Thermoplasmatota archaeon]|nr:aminotransferase class I/II-fold pyridoxal phosphate-dependent enzyme [Candidatus Thermoplasmatota archaeon]
MANEESDKKGLGKGTKSVHSGTSPSENSLNTPVYQTSTFYLDDNGYKMWMAGEPRAPVYSGRYYNPTNRAVERKIADLEGAEDALVFSSGMAAICTTLLNFLGQGDRIVTTRNLYGGTVGVLDQDFVRFGIDVHYIDVKDLDAVESALKEKETKVLYCETITNPLLEASDLPALASLAKKYGAVSIVDSTFATPISCNPIEHGFDLVIHSVTKMLNGHSDLLGGVVAGNKNLINKIWEKLRNFGGSMDPHQASLVERGIKTLQIRYERSTETAGLIAEWLESHPKIKKVIYPGLKSHEDHELCKSMLSGFGNMVSFVVDGGDDAGRKMLNNMTVASQAISLGGVESLISMPYATTHASWTQEARISAGIDLGFVRFSTGLEDFDDLKNDFDQALSSL